MATKRSPTWGDFEEDVKEAAMTKGPACQTCRLLEEVDGEAREAIVSALRNPDYSSNSIRRALQKRLTNIKVPIPSGHAFARHRRNECGGNA